MKNIFMFGVILFVVGCSGGGAVKKEASQLPAVVKNLKIVTETGMTILSWDASPVQENVVSYTVLIKEGLENYKPLSNQILENRCFLGGLEQGVEYSFMVMAVNTKGRKSKGAEIEYYEDLPKVELLKNATVEGHILSARKGGKLVYFYPVHLGAFDNYDTAPTVATCDENGHFSGVRLPAGVYTVKAFCDINGNGVWDGNWLGFEAEPLQTIKSIVFRPDESHHLEIRLSEMTNGLPEPVYEENPDYVRLYNAAWEFAREKISKGMTNNGFVPAYMDEGFNNHIYQWDTCFMMFFGVYGGNEFPAMASVDNFYHKQRASGYICRVQNEDTGKDYNPSKHDPSVNPPLFTMAEWNYYRLSGDHSRILNALSHNHRYFRWLKRNCRTKEGYYFTSNLGSGMDNSPREGLAYGWVDMTAQMALFAYYMNELSLAIGLQDLARVYQTEFDELSRLINEKMWDDEVGIYFDVKKNGELHKKKTIASFWTLLARIVSPERAKRLLLHLQNPNEFATPHRFPTLSKDEAEYDKKGYYWRGAVWAPTEYMVIKGLEFNGFWDYARDSAINHISNMLSVYLNFVPDKKKLPYKNPNIPFPDELDGTLQIWECYSSELNEPATRWDNQYYVRPKFVGWSGVGPIALFIENVIGISLDAPKQRIVWRIGSSKPNGVKNLHFNGGVVNLMMEGIKEDVPLINVNSTVDMTLEIHYQGTVREMAITGM